MRGVIFSPLPPVKSEQKKDAHSSRRKPEAIRTRRRSSSTSQQFRGSLSTGTFEETM